MMVTFNTDGIMTDEKCELRGSQISDFYPQGLGSPEEKFIHFICRTIDYECFMQHYLSLKYNFEHHSMIVPFMEQAREYGNYDGFVETLDMVNDVYTKHCGEKGGKYEMLEEVTGTTDTEKLKDFIKKTEL